MSVENSVQNDTSKCFFCCEPCSELCSHCKLINYCCEAHFSIHRPENFCFPFRVESSQSVGRYVVAARDIKPTEMILYDSPAVLGPKSATENVCLQCLKKIDGTMTCEKCGWPVCDLKCQNGKTHQKECDILSGGAEKINFGKTEMYRGITPLRLLLNEKSDSSLTDRLKFLMDHDAERKNDESLFMNLKKFYDVFRSTYKLHDFTEEQFDRAVGILWTNSFECCKGGGQALFPTFSLLSHSCLANACHVVFPNNHLVLHAKVPIKCGDEITISYISALQGKLRRRIKLRDKWYFICSCPRCLDPTENGSHCSTLICQETIFSQPYNEACAISDKDSDKKCTISIEDCNKGCAVSSGDCNRTRAISVEDCDKMCAISSEEIGKVCGGLVLQEDTSQVASNFSCQSCHKQISHMDVLHIENELVKDLQECTGDVTREIIDKPIEKLNKFLHPNHYLSLLAKRHLIVIDAKNLKDMNTNELQQRKKLCEEVLQVLDLIEPGIAHERGTILSHLAETSKLLSKKLFSQDLITEEEFSKMIQKSIDYFNDYQKCLILSFKKEA